MALTLMLASNVQAQTQSPVQTFVVLGTSPVRSGNVSQAREKAISESLVAAVALATADIMRVDALVRNFTQLNETIYNQADSYVQDYKVLTEATFGQIYRVMVQVRVATGKMTQQLTRAGVLQTEKPLPSVVLLIAEQQPLDVRPRYWWGPGMQHFQSATENAMAASLSTKGFTVIDHAARVLQTAAWEAEDNPDLDNREAVKLGALLQADLVVVGTSIVHPTPNTTDSRVRSYKAILTARVLRTDTGEEIANITRTAMAADADGLEGSQEALAVAGSLSGQALTDQLVAAWQQQTGQAMPVEILVEGTGKLGNFIRFRQKLSEISGVKAIHIKEIKPNEATLRVDYQGRLQDLIDALKLKDFESFHINIQAVAPNNLKIQLI
ncbi:MAG: hypothetical protein JSW39_00040 [Desulfobacterales bacterium]|nr:MAG: hypothetical protein JSW39_00040 [Desulfobacterales bacterium]